VWELARGFFLEGGGGQEEEETPRRNPTTPCEETEIHSLPPSSSSFLLMGRSSLGPLVLCRMASFLHWFVEQCYAIPNAIETRLGTEELRAVASALQIGSSLLSLDSAISTAGPGPSSSSSSSFSSPPMASSSSSSSFSSLSPVLHSLHLGSLFLLQALLKRAPKGGSGGIAAAEKSRLRLALRTLFVGLEAWCDAAHSFLAMGRPKSTTEEEDEEDEEEEESDEATRAAGWTVLLKTLESGWSHAAAFSSSTSSSASYAPLLLLGAPQSWLLAPLASWVAMGEEERGMAPEEEVEAPTKLPSRTDESGRKGAARRLEMAPHPPPAPPREKRRIQKAIQRAHDEALEKWSRWLPYVLSLDPRVMEVVDGEALFLHGLKRLVDASASFVVGRLPRWMGCTFRFSPSPIPVGWPRRFPSSRTRTEPLEWSRLSPPSRAKWGRRRSQAATRRRKRGRTVWFEMWAVATDDAVRFRGGPCLYLTVECLSSTT